MLTSMAVLLLATYCNCQNSQNTSLQVLVIVSVMENEGSQGVAWTQGKDIYYGACMAAQDINKDPDFLQQFEVVPVLVPQCDPVQGIDQLFKALDSSRNIIGVTGMFCDKVAQFYSPVLQKWKKNLQISGATFEREEDEEPPTFYILPSSEDIANAIISLLDNLNWTRVGIVYAQPEYGSCSSSNYFNLAKTLNTVANQRHSPHLQVLLYYKINGVSSQEVKWFLRSLISSEVHILVLLVPPHIASFIMQNASDEGMVWPQYVWIFVHVDPAVISLSPLWEKVIFMTYKLPALEISTGSCLVNYTSTSSPYSSLLYDSVMGLALAWNETLNSVNISSELNQHSTNILGKRLKNLSFEGKTGQVKFKERDESIRLKYMFIKNNKINSIGQYSFSEFSIVLDDILLQPVPPDRFKSVVLNLPLSASVPLLLWLFLMYILVTFNFSLFVIFRKEREVKASSVSLSMCIFVGSYLLLLTSTNSVIVTGFVDNREKIRHVTCNIEQLCATVGLDLIISTALVRTLRIHHIFHNFGKLGKSWRDSRLVLIIAAIISVKVGVFILWMSVDNNHLVDTVVFQRDAVPPHYLVIQPCYCNYQGVWVFAVYIYTVALLTALFVLAIKTRKITHGDFKDTKKTTLLVLCLLVLLVVFGLLWGILRQVGQPIASYISLDLGYSLGFFMIQITLFLPKVLPPLCRYMKCIRRGEPLSTSTNTFNSSSATAFTTVKSVNYMMP